MPMHPFLVPRLLVLPHHVMLGRHSHTVQHEYNKQQCPCNTGLLHVRMVYFEHANQVDAEGDEYSGSCERRMGLDERQGYEARNEEEDGG